MNSPKKIGGLGGFGKPSEIKLPLATDPMLVCRKEKCYQAASRNPIESTFGDASLWILRIITHQCQTSTFFGVDLKAGRFNS